MIPLAEKYLRLYVKLHIEVKGNRVFVGWQ